MPFLSTSIAQGRTTTFSLTLSFTIRIVFSRDNRAIFLRLQETAFLIAHFFIVSFLIRMASYSRKTKLGYLPAYPMKNRPYPCFDHIRARQNYRVSARVSDEEHPGFDNFRIAQGLV